MRPKRWLELIKDYDCTINYHPWKSKCGSRCIEQEIKIKVDDCVRRVDTGI